MNDIAQHPDDSANAFDAALARLRIRIDAACSTADDWPARVAAGIRAALRFAAAHPADAQALTNDALAQGRAGYARYDGMIDGFGERLLPGRALRPEGERLPEITERAMAGGLAMLIAQRLDTGPTVAVLGSGTDVAHPASHRSLWRRICEQGLVLSELPPGTGAWRWTFPARNWIMAALAGMTVVVEAAQRSGSLITADLAADLGRDLGAVPGPVNSRFSAGTNDLLAGGACLVRDAQDVLDAMLSAGVERPRPTV